MLKDKRKKILAVDYGRSKIGLALATTPLAEPYKVIRYKKEQEGLRELLKAIEQQKIEQVVIGISEGEMAQEIREFGEKLENRIDIPVIYQDETLSTQDAQRMTIQSGMNRKKRRELEDAFAACVMLQTYLDNQ